jgi:hypothetical protein
MYMLVLCCVCAFSGSLLFDVWDNAPPANAEYSTLRQALLDKHWPSGAPHEAFGLAFSSNEAEVMTMLTGACLWEGGGTGCAPASPLRCNARQPG